MDSILNELSTSTTVLDGAVTFHMMGYFTMPMRIQYQTIRKLVEEDEHSYHFNVFCLFESSCVNIEFANADNPHIRALEMYWERHTTDMTKNWGMYYQWISDGMNDAIYEAYQSTRYDLPKPPGMLGEPAPDSDTDPKGSSSIGKKSGK